MSDLDIRAVLRDGQEHLDHLLQSIAADASRGDLADLRDEWRAFESELRARLDVEESHIIRAFAQESPDEARALLAAHDRMRARVTELGVELDLHALGAERVLALLDDLRAHERAEQELLYPWADRRLDPRVHAQLRGALAVNRSRPVPLPTGGDWRIDPDRSSLQFSLRHIVFSEIRGAFTTWGGAVRFEEADLTRSGVDVWVDLGSVTTGDRERDAHVRSPEFFDVQAFPRARFTSTQVRMADDRRAVICGELDLHGIERLIELEATIHRTWVDASGDERMGIRVNGRLDRRSFGLRWNQDLDLGGVVVGDQIEIAAHLECVRS